MRPSYTFTPRKRPSFAPFDRHRNTRVHQNRIRNFTITIRNAQKQIIPQHPHRDRHHRTLRIPRNRHRHPRQNSTTTQDNRAAGTFLQSRTRRQRHTIANLIRTQTRPQHRKELRPVNRGRNRRVHINTNRTKEYALTTSHPRTRHRRPFKGHTQSTATHSHTTSQISRDRDTSHRRHRHKRATRRTQRKIHRTLPHPIPNHQRSHGALYPQTMSTTHHSLVIPEITHDTTRPRNRRRRIPTYTSKHRTIITPQQPLRSTSRQTMKLHPRRYTLRTRLRTLKPTPPPRHLCQRHPSKPALRDIPRPNPTRDRHPRRRYAPKANTMPTIR